MLGFEITQLVYVNGYLFSNFIALKIKSISIVKQMINNKEYKKV